MCSAKSGSEQEFRTSYTDSLGRSTTTAYDTLGNLTTQTDPRGNPTTYAYDAYNRRISMTDAATHVTHYAYDGNGNKTSETDANNHTAAYTYDDANRQTVITYADTSTDLTGDFCTSRIERLEDRKEPGICRRRRLHQSRSCRSCGRLKC